MQPRQRSSRPFWVAIQPSIVRIYKVAGLVALTAILVGLIAFLVINIFYFFDHSWVRPVVLSPTHQRVVEATTQVADARLRASQLITEKLETENELAELERSIIHDERCIVEAGTRFDAPRTADEWMARREVQRCQLDRENLTGRRAPLGQRVEGLKLRIKDQDEVVHRLAQSPYLKAASNKVTLAFVPNQNLRNIKLGTPLYGCRWGLVWCRKVGTVKAVLEGEVQNIHPHDESVQRGLMLEVDVSEWGATEAVLFAGGKPLWFL